MSQKIILVLIGFYLSCCARNSKSPQEQELTTKTARTKELFSSPCIDSSKIDKHVFCIQVYEPVCGCDGKTYSNSCEASKNGIVRWAYGACEESK